MDERPSFHETHAGEDNEMYTDFGELIRLYQTQAVPGVIYDDTTQLIKVLLVEQTVTTVKEFSLYHFLWSAVRMMPWRMRLLGAPFWIISAGFLLAGLCGGWFLPGDRIVSLLILCLPLMGLLGVVSLLKMPSQGLREVEVCCPTSFTQMIVVSTLLATAINCMTGLFLTIVVAILHWTSFITLLVTWLGPLLLLTAIVVLLALRWNTRLALLAGGSFWLIFIGHTLLLEHDITRAALLILPHNQMGIIAYLCAGATGLVILVGLFWRGESIHRGPLMRFYNIR